MSTPPPTPPSGRFVPDYPPLTTLPTAHPPLKDGETLDEFNKMIRGQPYIAVDPFLMRTRGWAVEKCEEYNLPGKDEKHRQALLSGWVTLSEPEPQGHADGVFVMKPFICEYGFNIKFGKEIYLGPGCTLIDVAPIYIGSRSMLGANVQIYTPTHPLSPEARNGLQGPEGAAPVTIGTDVWIGAGAIILPGITIGDGATVGAGSVVSKNVEARTVVVGNPARIIRRIEADGTVVDARVK